MAELTAQDPITGLMRSLQATHMDPAVETISGSPMTSHGGKYFPRTQLHGDRGFFGEAHSSPSKNSSTGNLDGNGCIVSSPTTNRVKEIRESPNWRTKQEIFVRQSGTHGSDPFVSNDNARHSQGMPILYSSGQCMLTVQGNNSPFSPRQDRIGVPISSDNAQGVLLPSACVFVAK